jgi:hypothetical protein
MRKIILIFYLFIFNVNPINIKSISKFYIKHKIKIQKTLIITCQYLVFVIALYYILKKINETQPLSLPKNAVAETDSSIPKSSIQYKHYNSIEDLFSDNSEEGYTVRKKIANVLSKKKLILLSEAGILQGTILVPSFLFLDKKFNTRNITENEKIEIYKIYNNFPEILKNRMLEIINQECFNDTIKK